MKLLPLIALSAIAITANAQNYKITGTADSSMEGKMIYLVDHADMNFKDSCAVANGAFSFTGNVKGEKLFQIRPARGRGRADVIVANNSNVVVNLKSNPATVTDNGGLNDKLNAIQKTVNDATVAVNTKAEQMLASGKSQSEVAAALKGDISNVYVLYQKAINDNKDNMVGAYILSMTAQTLYPNPTELIAVIKATKYANEIMAIKRISDALAKAEATSAGKMFTDFQGFTVDGKPSKLSDFVGKGKYVLVDFWASWCGPCRGEIPNLIELQNKYGGEKFTLLGVNVWDEKENFMKSMTEEGINYPQIYIPRDNKDNATEIYGINGIPQIMLFGPDGTILRRDLRGEEMKAYVAEQLAK